MTPEGPNETELILKSQVWRHDLIALASDQVHAEKGSAACSDT
jgi:hypothetical protein